LESVVLFVVVVVVVVVEILGRMSRGCLGRGAARARRREEDVGAALCSGDILCWGAFPLLWTLVVV